MSLNYSTSNGSSGSTNDDNRNRHYEDVCRTCLLHKSKTHSLFEKNIDKMLMDFTSIQVRISPQYNFSFMMVTFVTYRSAKVMVYHQRYV